MTSNNQHPVGEKEWQAWCDKMNAGHHAARSDRFFFLLPSIAPGQSVYPKGINYGGAGSFMFLLDPNNAQRVKAYFDSCGVPEHIQPILRKRIEQDARQATEDRARDEERRKKE